MPDLSYPIGRFEAVEGLSSEQLAAALDDIAALPAELRTLASSLTPAQLDTAYRPGGWTGRQVIHHIADSHMHAYIRTKFALTQDRPTIMPYNPDDWAALADSASGEIDPSLAVIEGVHERWGRLLRSLSPEQWSREFVHPEYGPRTLGTTIQLYRWHGKHHTAHLGLLK